MVALGQRMEDERKGGRTRKTASRHTRHTRGNPLGGLDDDDAQHDVISADDDVEEWGGGDGGRCYVDDEEEDYGMIPEGDEDEGQGLKGWWRKRGRGGGGLEGVEGGGGGGDDEGQNLDELGEAGEKLAMRLG